MLIHLYKFKTPIVNSFYLCNKYYDKVKRLIILTFRNFMMLHKQIMLLFGSKVHKIDFNAFFECSLPPLSKSTSIMDGP